MKYDLNQIILADCMDIMRDIPDKYFELAIVDPPYGIGHKLCVGGCSRPNRMQEMYLASKWEDVAPEDEYFIELRRISINQIIWGGNYFHLKPCRGFIIWDKIKFVTNYSQAEYAWTSFDCVSRIFRYCSNGGFLNKPIDYKIHPTQKPVALYRWLLLNYAKHGDKIIDTHSGSGSCAIACHIEKHDFLAIEKDPDYHAASVKRLEEARAQGVLF